MSKPATSSSAWWGSFTLEEGKISYWQIGPSQFWITRYAQEWRITNYQAQNADLSTMSYAAQTSPEQIHPEAKTNRYGFTKAPQTLHLSPLVTDRSIIVKPKEPFYVQSGEEVTLYNGASIWIQVKVGDPAKALLDVASFRPSDTWFGSSTIDGELCYASSTQGRLRLEDVQLVPHRAITAIKLHNKAKDPLFLDRVNLPVKYLSIYSINEQLWTQSVSLTREQSGDLAALKIAKGPPSELGKATQLSGPREKLEQNVVLKAFSKLFNSG